MAVYVDNADILASVPNGNRMHTSHWCQIESDVKGDER